MKKRIILSLGILLAAGVVSGVAAQADQGGMAGSVAGATPGSLISGAVVRFVNVVDGREYSSRPTGQNGRFDMAGIEEGRYAVTVSAGGSSFTLQERVYVKGGESGDLPLSVGSGADPNAGIAQFAPGGGMGTITDGCIRPPKPPKPPKSKHRGHGHGHDDD